MRASSLRPADSNNKDILPRTPIGSQLCDRKACQYRTATNQYERELTFEEGLDRLWRASYISLCYARVRQKEVLLTLEKVCDECAVESVESELSICILLTQLWGSDRSSESVDRSTSHPLRLLQSRLNPRSIRSSHQLGSGGICCTEHCSSFFYPLTTTSSRFLTNCRSRCTAVTRPNEQWSAEMSLFKLAVRKKKVETHTIPLSLQRGHEMPIG